MPTKFFEKKSEIVDHASGEVTETLTVSVKVTEGEDAFIKTYIRDIAILHQCKGKELNVLFEILGAVDYKNEFSLSAGTKKMMCTRIGMFKKGTQEPSLNWFNVSMYGLVQRKIIFNNGAGMYSISPFLFGKGKWPHIKAIRLKIDYTPEGRIVKTDTE